LPEKPIPQTTIVVTIRDRLSTMPESLASLLENTPEPFELVYVTGKLPKRVRAWIDQEAAIHGFIHINGGRHMTPAESRNAGLACARGEYVVFVENDIVFETGWLSALISCADATHADAVAPLTCEGRPIHTTVHHVGPEQTNHDDFGDAPIGARDFDENFFLQGLTREEAAPMLGRRRTRYVEMHCFLARRDVLDRVGGFDPDIVSKEYLDFSWAVGAAGGAIWVEPKAVVTFLVPSESDPVQFGDLRYFLLRWSTSWQRRSHDALRAKWGFKEDGYIASRRNLADWRIIHHVVRPALAHVPVLGRHWGFVQRSVRVLSAPIMAASALFAWQYDRARRTESTGSPAHASV